MRKLWIAVAVVLLCTPALSAGIWPFNKGKAYNLGADPTIKGHHALEDGLGFMRVEAYRSDTAELTLTFLSGAVELKPDRGYDDAMPCAVGEPVTLKPTQVCGLWGKDVDAGREYHLRVSWSHEEKRGVWVVMLRVKKATLKVSG